MRVVYQPPIVSQLEDAIHTAENDHKSIARFELNTYEILELDKYFDNIRSAETGIKGNFVYKTRTYRGIPVIEISFTEMTEIEDENQ